MGVGKEGRPLDRCTTAGRFQNTIRSWCVNPVGAENGVRVYKKIKLVMPLTGRLCGLLSTGCTLVGNAYLQIIAITRLN